MPFALCRFVFLYFCIFAFLYFCILECNTPSVHQSALCSCTKPCVPLILKLQNKSSLAFVSTVCTVIQIDAPGGFSCPQYGQNAQNQHTHCPLDSVQTCGTIGIAVSALSNVEANITAQGAQGGWLIIPYQ